MTEEERKKYNKKLIKQGFADEMKKPHFDWRHFLINTAGCALGLVLCGEFGITERFGGASGVIISVLITTVCIFLTELAAKGITKLMVLVIKWILLQK